MGFDLSELLSGHVFAFMLVFTRMSGAFMMFPGIGESFVPARVRMLFALAFSLLILPVLLPKLPALPPQTPDLAFLIMKEVFIGIFFGTVMRLLMDILETAGSVIAMETGLSNAMILNPAMASQSALSSAFLGVAGIALLFSTGLDQLLFRALMDTYKAFPPGGAFPAGDMVEAFIRLISQCFSIGIQLALPFMVAGLLLNTVLGMIQRMMPQVQLFLVLIPVQIFGGLYILAVVVGAIMAAWLRAFDDSVVQLFVR